MLRSLSELIPSKIVTLNMFIFNFHAILKHVYVCVHSCDGIPCDRNYYDTLEKLFGKKGVPQQLQAVLKVLPQNKRKLIQDVCDALNK